MSMLGRENTPDISLSRLSFLRSSRFFPSPQPHESSNYHSNYSQSRWSQKSSYSYGCFVQPKSRCRTSNASSGDHSRRRIRNSPATRWWHSRRKILSAGEKAEVPLAFFHAGPYFAREEKECARLQLKVNLGNDSDAQTTASTLFYGAYLCPIALKGTENGVYALGTMGFPIKRFVEKFFQIDDVGMVGGEISISSQPASTIVMDLFSYSTTYSEDDSFRCLGHPEPYIRQQELIFCWKSSRWHVKITFNSTALKQSLQDGSESLCSFLRRPIMRNFERRQEFHSLIRLMKLERLVLLDNTVTKIDLRLNTRKSRTSDVCLRDVLPDRSVQDAQENRFLDIAHRLTWTIHEDGSRVLYPPHVSDPSWPTRLLSDVKIEEDIAGSAFRVQVCKEKRSYIYKNVDRPFYKPGDSAVIQQEMQNLKLFRGDPNIVQLFAVVISTNPYQTRIQVDNPTVIRGILLEHHPGGTFEERLEKQNIIKFPWRRWPLQIGYGLLRLHQENVTHMDLKPPNIVIDCDGNAVLIDISGIGGVTYEWLAPELRHEDVPSFPLEARKLNDIWAYGMLLSAVARCVDGNQGADLLFEVAMETTNDRPELRISLSDVISKLQRLDLERSHQH